MRKFLAKRTEGERCWRCRIGRGGGGGRSCRRRGRRPPRVECEAGERHGGSMRSRACSEGLGVSIYSATRSVPRRWIRAAGEPPFCSCRGTWRRRELGDTLVDELVLLQGPGGERARLGRRCPWQRRTADAGVPPRTPWRRRCSVPGWFGAMLRGGERVARFCRAGQSRGGQRVGSAAWLQYARSGRVQCTHGMCSTKCHGTPERLVGAGI